MTFNDIFGVTYATFCGVQLGESFVSRPANIGAGEWMKFWEQLFKYADSDELPIDIEAIESENEDLREENDDLNNQVTELEKKIDRLEDALAEANYALGQKFGDRI